LYYKILFEHYFVLQNNVHLVTEQQFVSLRLQKICVVGRARITEEAGSKSGFDHFDVMLAHFPVQLRVNPLPLLPIPQGSTLSSPALGVFASHTHYFSFGYAIALRGCMKLNSDVV